MSNLWKLSEPKSDKLIVVKDNTIYKGNPNPAELGKLNLDAEGYRQIEKELFSIPFSYIKKIVNQRGVRYIKIFFGKDSEEELNVDNEHIKNEIFDVLKKEMQELKYTKELPSMLGYAKTQVFALLILTGIFIWAMHYAIEISNGTIYEYSGNGQPGIATLIFSFAGLGITKLIISYTLLGGLAIFSLFRKLKSRTERQVLQR